MNKHQEALDIIKNTKLLVHMHDDIVNEIKIFDEDDMNIELLQELVDKFVDLEYWWYFHYLKNDGSKDE